MENETDATLLHHMLADITLLELRLIVLPVRMSHEAIGVLAHRLQHCKDAKMVPKAIPAERL